MCVCHLGWWLKGPVSLENRVHHSEDTVPANGFHSRILIQHIHDVTGPNLQSGLCFNNLENAPTQQWQRNKRRNKEIQIAVLCMQSDRPLVWIQESPPLLLEQGWATGGPRAAYGPHPHSVRPAHNFYLIKKKQKKNRVKENLRKKKIRVSVHRIQRQTHVSSLLRSDISH